MNARAHTPNPQPPPERDPIRPPLHDEPPPSTRDPIPEPKRDARCR